MTFPSGKNFIASAVLLGILFSPAVFGLVIPQTAHATSHTNINAAASGLKSNDALVQSACSGWSTYLQNPINCTILTGVWLIDLFLAGTVLNFATMVFDWSISYNIGDLTKNEFVSIGWGIVRDITNLFFIFILLWIALATIFGIQGYGAKDLLAQLVIAALLINFSLAIGGFVVRFTNALGMAFYTPIQNKLSDRLLGFTKIQIALTQPLDTQSKQSVCERWGQDQGAPGASTSATEQVTEQTPEERKANYQRLFNECMNNPSIAQFAKDTGDRETQKRLTSAIYQALWLIIIIPIIAFVFLAGAIFFLIRYLTLSVLLVFAPIVFLLRILPDTKFLWNDWWNRFTRQAFFAPAFFFMLFLTVVAFDKVSNANVGNPVAMNALSQETIIAKEPPRLNPEAEIMAGTPIEEDSPVGGATETAAIGGIGTGFQTQEALAQGAGAGATPQKGFFGIGFDMFLFVALMIMNLMVAQQAGIQLSGTVIGWGNKAAGWAGKKTRGLAYKGAIRGAEPATTALAESKFGRALAGSKLFRGLTRPALAIHEERERLDTERAKQVERAAAFSPDLAWSRLKGESMGVKAAYAKSANAENMGKLMEKMEPKEREEFVAQLHANRAKYRIDESALAQKVGEAMKKSPEGLTLRTIAKAGMLPGNPEFGKETTKYLDGLTDPELQNAMTANVIRKNKFAREYMINNFKNERRIGQALLGTPEKADAFMNMMIEEQNTMADTDPTAALVSPAEVFADIMRVAGNTEGARDIMTNELLAVLSGAGAQPFVRRRRPPRGGGGTTGGTGGGTTAGGGTTGGATGGAGGTGGGTTGGGGGSPTSGTGGSGSSGFIPPSARPTATYVGPTSGGTTSPTAITSPSSSTTPTSPTTVVPPPTMASPSSAPPIPPMSPAPPSPPTPPSPPMPPSASPPTPTTPPSTPPKPPTIVRPPPAISPPSARTPTPHSPAVPGPTPEERKQKLAKRMDETARRLRALNEEILQERDPEKAFNLRKEFDRLDALYERMNERYKRI